MVNYGLTGIHTYIYNRIMQFYCENKGIILYHQWTFLWMWCGRNSTHIGNTKVFIIQNGYLPIYPLVMYKHAYQIQY